MFGGEGGFNNILQTAANIKSTYLNQDKKVFNKLPEFYKTGLYYSKITENVRNQSFILQKFSFETLRHQGLEFIKKNNYDDAHYCFSKGISIFKHIKSSNLKWKTDGGIKDEELTYYEEKGSNKEEKDIINSFMISGLLNISLCCLQMEKWEECRQACEEVLKRDDKCVKA